MKATAEKPLVIRGESLGAVIEGSGDEVDGIRVQDCSHVYIENLTVKKANRAGLAVRYSDHVTVSGCRFADNEKWGIITSFADDMLFENNECYGSKVEHGIYHANSGDRFVIRGNLVHDNAGNGIHLNGDPEIKGGDGVLNQGIVESNIIYGNGKRGGAAINMTHVQDIIVRNNLINNNYAAGITAYQDTGTFEQGSKRILILNNTIFFRQGDGRACLNVQTTTEKLLYANNIFVGGGNRGVIEVHSDYLASIMGDNNIFWGATGDRVVDRKQDRFNLAEWRKISDNDEESLYTVPSFTDVQQEEFTLTDSSAAIDQGFSREKLKTFLSELDGFDWIVEQLDLMPSEDLREYSRPVNGIVDIGAFEYGADSQ